LIIYRCSFIFWIIFFIPLIICWKINEANFNQLQSEHEYQTILKLESDKNIIVDNKSKIMYNCILSGIIAGMLGIGGGMIITPLMLELGFDMKITRTTSNLLLIFTSLLSLFYFIFVVFLFNKNFRMISYMIIV